MLSAANLRLLRGSTQLAIECFSVSANTCHVITGPTGCGKTLFLESLLGLNQADGKVDYNGQDLSHTPTEARGFGYVPQDLALFPHLTVLQNIRYPIDHGKPSGNATDQRIEQLCRVTRIEHLLNRYPAHLSGGEKQRVALVRALAGGASVALLDEPFSALNQTMRREIWQLLKSLQRDYQLHLVLVTHDIDEAMYLGDVISIMDSGRLIQSGPKQTVYDRPANLTVATLLGIKNLFSGTLERLDERQSRIKNTQLGQDVFVWTEHLADGMTDQQDVTAGIRSTEVMVLRENAPLPGRRNILTGEIGDIIHSGSYSTVAFEPDASELSLEITLNTHAFRKLALGPGQRRSVSLKEESLFVCPSASKT